MKVAWHEVPGNKIKVDPSRRMCLAKSPDLKPTSAVGSGSLKDPAHLFNFLT